MPLQTTSSSAQSRRSPNRRRSSPGRAQDESDGSIGDESEIGYDQEDEIILPTNTARPTANLEDEEGGYSADELFAGDSDVELEILRQRAPPIPLSPTAVTDDDLPAVRPNFETDLPFAEPLQLDHTQTGISIPAPINRFLKEYQKDGVRFLYAKYASGKGGVLGDDMG
jgi:SNF2 family DNA or RNA helicase